MSKTSFISLTASLVLAITFTLSCDSKEFTDSRDGKTYKKVKIGSQTWMAENLNFAAFRSLCYENKPENCEKYGRLYDWETAMKACPSGWHLPSGDEYGVLDDAVGGEKVAGKHLKAASGLNPSSGIENLDTYGFSAPLGGYGRADGIFIYYWSIGYWWSATEIVNDSDYAYSRYMYYDKDYTEWLKNNKSLFFSVRCIQN